MKQLLHISHIKKLTPLLVLPFMIGVNTNTVHSNTVDNNSVDISNWKCKFCPFEEVQSTDITLGVLYVDDDSYKYGEHSTLAQSGTYLLLDARLRYRNEDTTYMELNAYDLGLSKRSLDLEMGMQGLYKIMFDFDESRHFISSTIATPYTGAGTSIQTLPPGWVTSGSSSGMTTLASSLKPFELKNSREKISIGAGVTHDKHWNYNINFNREHRNGSRGGAGAFFLKATELVIPVNYVTDEVNVSASHSGKKLQTKFSYFSSVFSNSDKSVQWQNAFTPLVAGADIGELATSPDNEFHQLSLHAGYQITAGTRVMGDIAIGRMRQNERFLNSTTNTLLGVAALPRDSLNGKVDTLNSNIKLHSKVSNKLRVNATLRYDERDNETPQNTYTWVSSDSFIAAPRSNLPYSFRRNNVKLKADYNTTEAIKLSAAAERDIRRRTFQEVERTTENTLWGKIKARTDDKTEFTLKYSHIDRMASDYTVVPEIDGAQNPLMRKYNMADRVANRVNLHISRAPYIHTQYSIGLDYETNDYDDSTIGLTESENIKFNSDISYVINEKSNVYIFFNREKIDSDIAGSQSFSQPAWFANNKDRITTIGLGINHFSMDDKLNIGMDFALTRSTGEILINTTPQQAGLPDIISKLDSVKFYADYKLKDNITLSAAYWFESYDVEDWSIDGMTETTVSSLLGLAEDNPTYNVDAITVLMRYTF